MKDTYKCGCIIEWERQDNKVQAIKTETCKEHKDKFVGFKEYSLEEDVLDN